MSDPAIMVDDAIETVNEKSNKCDLIDDQDQRLQKEYTFWVFMKSRADGDWKPKPIASFGTIRSFWNVYQYLKRPSQLEQGTMFHCFTKGVEPAWEDKANEKGGRF